jgi:S1-C subfamily serine protease
MSMYEYDEPSYPQRTPRRLTLFPVILFLMLAGIITWRFWPREPDSGLDPNAVPRPVVARGELADDEKATIALYRQSAPSVVHVTRMSGSEQFFGLDVMQIPSGTGSGFVWDDSGHIVTNNHVVEGGFAFQVVLWDHSKWTARMVGSESSSDLAVLKIDAPKAKLRPLMVGSSHDLQVGQKAYAIGNPFGLDQSLTSGVVSALDRDITAPNQHSIKGAIQTNAAINPGNSGGPLLDSAGRLIGVNTAIISPSGTSSGIGFAIPVDEVNRVVPQLIRHGKIVRPGLGVRVASDQLNAQLRLDDEGVLVIDVVPESPAATAGLRPTRRDRDGNIRLGDIIKAVDGAPVHSAQDLHAVLDKYKVGDTVTVTVRRDDEDEKVPVTLAAIR